MPDDLKALDEELSSIKYEERASFEPELRAELARIWAEQPRDTRRWPTALRRHLAAAALAGLLVGSASVPSARASFVRLMGVLTPAPVELEPPPPAATIVSEPVAEEAELLRRPTDEVLPVPAPAPQPLFEETPEIITGTTLAAPQLMDRARSERLLEEAYPMHLQRQGIGGTVRLRLWVEATGRPGLTDVAVSSGVRELDRAALEVAPTFLFAPALQDGRRMGTWIEFPVVFEPDATVIERGFTPGFDPLSLPTVHRDDQWEMSEPLDLDALENVPPVALEEERAAAGRSLARALSDPSLIETFGPAEAMVTGVAPDGRPPTDWRAAVGAALELSIETGRENPASLLALGRIRLRQGLRAEARSLFERGLQMTVQTGNAESPWVVAELHHERGNLLRESWLSSDAVGHVRVEAFAEAECAQARSSGGAESGFATADRLIAWNYLCPVQLKMVLSQGFVPANSGSAGDLTLMMASYRAAIDSYPGHIGANIGLLTTLASEGRWEDVLAGARRFTRVAGGHPDGLLFAGLALHRLGSTEEASNHFEAALERMSDAVRDELTDVGALLDPSEAAWYRRLPLDQKAVWEGEFWGTKDRTPMTELNERKIEHLTRASYAHFRFGDVFGDAGEVWVRFGEPNSIHIVDEGSGRLTEFWDYGSGPDITFVRWVSSKRTDLTPEGRAYVDDLGKIFPPQ